VFALVFALIAGVCSLKPAAYWLVTAAAACSEHVIERIYTDHVVL
jgi:hypothetical protein